MTDNLLTENIRPVAHWSTSQLYQSFLKVYEDYPVPFQPTPEEFRMRMNKLRLDSMRSLTCSHNDMLVGFILYAINEYQNIKTAYNGGTGVINGYRGRGIIDKLFEAGLQALYNDGVKRVLLEVINTNNYALKLYERLDFQYVRTLKSYKLPSEISQDDNKEIQLKKTFSFKPEYLLFQDFEPSFIDGNHHILHNLDNEQVVEAWYNAELVGYIIYQPLVGRVSQIAVKKAFRGKNIGKSLLRQAQIISSKPLTILNIPEDAHDTIVALETIGFKNEIDQFEMEFTL